MSGDATPPQIFGEASPQAAWRRRSGAKRVDKDVAQRQGSLSSLAFLTLGRDGALDFLNSDHRELGGRPIDVGSHSAEGAAKVRDILRSMIQARPRD